MNSTTAPPRTPPAPAVDDMAAARRQSGIARHALQDLLTLFATTPGVVRVLLFGSRARGDFRPGSDIDLALDAPDMSAAEFIRLLTRLDDLGLIYQVDLVHLQAVSDARFRNNIDADARLLWTVEPPSPCATEFGGLQLKNFQQDVLARLGDYVDELVRRQADAAPKLAKLQAMEGMETAARAIADFPRETWDTLRQRGLLPPRYAAQAHSSRFDGAGRAIPNLCLKVPTGGGKTLLAAAAVARVFGSWFKRSTGLVLWVVPNEAIYRQTLATLGNRDHPYRQILNVAGAGRVKVLEKNAPLSRLDVDSHLCVMVLMLASAARQTKETLRFFRDRGNVLGFLPGEDDLPAHWQLLHEVPNLDVYAPWGASAGEASQQMGSIVKSSLGNVMRLLRPMVVIDEGHHGYTENALQTLDGFNPGFLLELSATPRLASAKGSGSNILVDVRGTDLDEAQMIKLPIHVDVQHWSDWQACLMASVTRLNALQADAQGLQAETARHIRPILLVQVERTGADTRDAGFIHAEDVRAWLLQIGFTAAQVAVKTSEKNDLAAPENLDLLSPACEVRVIITKQALQEGWDCPFAYVLCALAAGRNPGAMTQLVGRILRQPQATKTGREALDGCYVVCHDAKTSVVVKAIKDGLEGEGLGDLTVRVSGDSGDAPQAQAVVRRRRPALAGVRLFLPRVTWVQADGQRRELVYDSDVLAQVDWAALDPATLAQDWAPNREAPLGEQFDLSLRILDKGAMPDSPRQLAGSGRLDRALLVRALLDLVPNPWWVWGWVDVVVQRLARAGFATGVLAASSASLTEKLRIDLEHARDQLAEAVFARCVADGRIEFALRADASNYELPMDEALVLQGLPQPLMREDHRPAEKSLLEPALVTPDLNGFEAGVAGYLDGKQAVQWWHRNVAKSQYGLQGWKRNKVYPDFVVALVQQDGLRRTVLLETKGAHLTGSADTGYKQTLLRKLEAMFQDARWQQVGDLELARPDAAALACDLLVDQAWRGALEHRWFGAPAPS